MQRAPAGPGAEVRKGIKYGLLSGLAGIMCCVSPVVLVLLGVATAAEAVTLGDTLYYGYAWFFRAFGLAVAAIAVGPVPAQTAHVHPGGSPPIVAAARRPGRGRRRHLHRAVLVHQVPGHLVRLTPPRTSMQ